MVAAQPGPSGPASPTGGALSRDCRGAGVVQRLLLQPHLQARQRAGQAKVSPAAKGAKQAECGPAALVFHWHHPMSTRAQQPAFHLHHGAGFER